MSGFGKFFSQGGCTQYTFSNGLYVHYSNAILYGNYLTLVYLYGATYLVVQTTSFVNKNLFARFCLQKTHTLSIGTWLVGGFTSPLLGMEVRRERKADFHWLYPNAACYDILDKQLHIF